MWTWWVEFAARQSQDELRRQYELIDSMEAQRRLLALLPFAISMLFLSPMLCVALAVLDTIFETLGIRLLGRADPQRGPGIY